MSHVTALPRRTARKNHQYSVRDARPSKSAYFARHAFTASPAGIRRPPVLDPETARNHPGCAAREEVKQVAHVGRELAAPPSSTKVAVFERLFSKHPLPAHGA